MHFSLLIFLIHDFATDLLDILSKKPARRTQVCYQKLTVLGVRFMLGTKWKLLNKLLIIIIWIRMQQWEKWFYQSGQMRQLIGKRIIFYHKLKKHMKCKKNRFSKKMIKKQNDFTFKTAFNLFKSLLTAILWKQFQYIRKKL